MDFSCAQNMRQHRAAVFNCRIAGIETSCEDNMVVSNAVVSSWALQILWIYMAFVLEWAYYRWRPYCRSEFYQESFQRSRL